MLGFAAALIVFLLAHRLPTRPGIRDRLTARLGERGYLAAYSALSLGLLAWLLSAAARAPIVVLWSQAPWQHWVALLAMPVALALFGAAATQPNPLSVAFRRDGYDPARPGVVAVTRHPILWSLGLWAAAHVPANGDLVSLILFGGLALFAFAGMPMVDRARRRRLGDAAWRSLAAGTRILPFAGSLPMRLDRRMLPGALAGLLVYGLLLADGHRRLFGVNPLP